MYWAAIKEYDVANGPGVRVSLFVSGCRHRCRGCFNREAWDFCYGTPYTVKTQEQILLLCQKTYITGLSLLGGEPMEPENAAALLPLVRAFRERFPKKNIWCYTGFVFETLYLLSEHDSRRELLSNIDVLVDGKFEESKKNAALLFRGSENQRILDVPASLQVGHGVWLAGVWQRTMGSGNIYDT